VTIIREFRDGDSLTHFDSAFWTKLLGSLMRRSSQWALANYPGDGCLARVVVAPGVNRGDSVILDSEADWRDRVLTVVGLVANPDDWSIGYTGPAYPGNPNDILTLSADGSLGSNPIATGYTGTGRALGTESTVHGYMTTFDSDRLRVFCSVGDGVLRLYRDVADPSTSPATYYLLVIATEQLGERSTPGTHASLAAVDGTEIHPHVLNGLQDRALLAQMRERADGGVPTNTWPLGDKLDAAGVPEAWTIRNAPRRQPAVGMHRRWLYGQALAGTEVVIDDTIDWRDRFVWGAGRVSTSTIGAGGASEGSHNAATSWRAARYTGAGSTGAVLTADYALHVQLSGSGVDLRARPSDGALLLRNDTVSTQHVTAFLAASFPFGPRSA